MNIHFTAQHSLALLPLCFLLGAGYAFALYWRDKRLGEFPSGLKRFMGLLRFTLASLLSFLLLSPMVEMISRQVEKPLVIVAQDNSRSIIAGGDSVFYTKSYPENLEALINRLSSLYDVKTFSFGEKISAGISCGYDERETDFSQLFKEIQVRYGNRNLGAVVLASDGLYNRGTDPLFALRHTLQAPVYTIALGDTTPKKDLAINHVVHNRIAFLNNEFPVQVFIDARGCAGQQTELTVWTDGKKLSSTPLSISSWVFHTSRQLQLSSDRTGVRRYLLKLAPLTGETNVFNNVREIFVDVLDRRQKILVLADAPHPDVAAIRQALSRNDNYEVYIENKLPASAYNLIILHQMPSMRRHLSGFISEAIQSGTPLLFILGSRTSLQDFNHLQAGLQIEGSKNRYDEAQAVPAPAVTFNLFTINDDDQRFFGLLPPLTVPFGQYRQSPGAVVFLQQRIGMAETNRPLILFNNQGETKAGIVTGEGLWKWRLSDFAQHQNHEFFNGMISKIVQYLALKADKSRFRITGKNRFNENEPVIFEAEVYNESYELVNAPEVSLQIIHSDGKRFPYQFSPVTTGYYLNAGAFPAGEYKYEAKVKQGDKLLSAKGEFSVTPLYMEYSNTTADHRMLYQLANNSGGNIVYPENLQELPQRLIENGNLKTISHISKDIYELINLRWLFALLLLLVTVEWSLRKYHGAY